MMGNIMMGDRCMHTHAAACAAPTPCSLLMPLTLSLSMVVDFPLLSSPTTKTLTCEHPRQAFKRYFGVALQACRMRQTF